MEINVYTEDSRSTFKFATRLQAYNFTLAVIEHAKFDYVLSAYDLKSDELLFEFNHIQ
jgi:hypothetical protein